ncbi:hypothetical protein JCM8097_003676 [Rhodosporidiobolus ruineniae]
MPLPVLPTSVVSLVVDQLHDLCHCSTEMWENGIAVALVCKAWTSPGCALAWQLVPVSLHVQYKPHLEHLNTLASRSFTGRLHLQTSTWDYEPTVAVRPEVAPDMLALVKVFLRGCTNLESLILKVFGDASPVIEAVLPSLNSAKLSHIFIGCSSYEEFDSNAFLSAISAFPSLKHLELFLNISGLADDKPKSEDVPMQPRLELHRLGLDFEPSDGAHGLAFLKQLAGMLDPTTLRVCDVQLSQNLVPFLRLLQRLPHLNALTIRARSAAGVKDLLPGTTRHLNGFRSLEQLLIKVKNSQPNILEESAELPSPVSLPVFLASFPSKLASVLVTGVYFTYPASIPPMAIPQAVLPAVFEGATCTVMCFGIESATSGGGRRRARPVVKRGMLFRLPVMEGDTGEPRWCRLATP